MGSRGVSMTPSSQPDFDLSALPGFRPTYCFKEQGCQGMLWFSRKALALHLFEKHDAKSVNRMSRETWDATPEVQHGE